MKAVRIHGKINGEEVKRNEQVDCDTVKSVGFHHKESVR